MRFASGTVLKEFPQSSEYLIMLGYSNIKGEDPELCSCLVVRPYQEGTRAEIIGIRMVSDKELVTIERPEWADYINVSW